ncbi:MAG: L,D-transpeptidase family protein [Actinomycetota bacterium]
MPSTSKVLIACVVTLMATLMIGVAPTSAQTPTPTPTPSGTSTPTPVPTTEPTPTPTEPAGAVTLRASRNRITFGQAVTLSGSIDHAVGGETIEIIDQDGRTRATTTTDNRGRFSVRLRPRVNSLLRARWLVAVSPSEPVRVKPIVTASLSSVYLFGKSKVTGRVRPMHRGDRIKVNLVRNGKTTISKRVRLNRRSKFSTKFTIWKPGTYKVRAMFDNDQHVPGFANTSRRTPSTPSLSNGSNSVYVKNLEKRLDQLGYHITGINTHYDHRTSDAMIAFNKVQGRSRVGYVTSSTWYALAEPKRPRPVSKSPGFHVEVDQSKQVLYMVRNGKVRKILHVSTGAGGATRNGVYHFFREVNGYSGGGLYYPTYFDGLRAIHGWPSVPTYNASHGCVRVPMWAAKWAFDTVELGHEIRVYGTP